MTNAMDVLIVLEEVAASMKESAEAIGAPSSSYDEGRLTAYYEAIETILTQCRIAGIEPGDIGMAGFSPESLLLGMKKAA